MYIDASALRLPNGITLAASSRPLTLTQVGSIIFQVSAELDGAAAAAGYAVPIAPPASGGPTGAYAQMQQYAQAGAGWLVLRDVFPNVSGTADRTSLASEYRDAYRSALKMIRDGTTPLVGAAVDTGSGGRQLPRGRGNASPAISMCWTP